MPILGVRTNYKYADICFPSVKDWMYIITKKKTTNCSMNCHSVPIPETSKWENKKDEFFF